MSLLTNVTERRMMDGTARMLLAESLFPLTALITVAFLTRQLGPQGYGLLALTLTTIIWIESAIMSFFAKATIKFVGEMNDWKPLGSTVIRLNLAAGCAAMVMVWLFAAPIGTLLNEPALAFYLRVGAVDIPILCVGQAYRNVLIGTGNFQGGAIGRVGRWLSRLGLVILLVEAGLSVTGALLGVIGSSAVELVLSRWYIGPGLWANQGRVAIPIQRYGTMLFLSSLCLICYNGMDLFMLKVLGGTAQQAGIYNAAQSLSFLPGLFSLTFSSVLLATLSRLLADHHNARAQELGRDAMRMTLWLVPVVAIIAGSAREIVLVVFGVEFVPAAPLLALLIAGGVANVMLIVSLTIMTAMGRPARTVAFSAPLVPLALGGHLLLIPRWGALGAAMVTVVISFIGAVAAVASVYGLWKVRPPLGTLLRSLMIGLVAAAGSACWETSGVLVFAKLIVLSALSLFCYWWLREFRESEVSFVRALLTGKTEALEVI